VNSGGAQVDLGLGWACNSRWVSLADLNIGLWALGRSTSQRAQADFSGNGKNALLFLLRVFFFLLRVFFFLLFLFFFSAP
jgi:hypothetical protein